MTTFKDLAANIRTDPVMVLRSGVDQAIHVSDGTRIAGELAISETLAEDCRSLIESAGYIVRYHEAGQPIRCECCGTPVAKMPEALCADESPRTWRPGIWESDALRKHTLRRCDWLRLQPASTR